MTTDNHAEQRVIITIDGPAGAGKSSTARRLARRLGLHFLDTGAMYRGVAAAALAAGLETSDNDAVAELAQCLHLSFNWADDPPTLRVDNVDFSRRIRDTDVTEAVSNIAANPQVRHILVRAQRWIGHRHPRLVSEGRDQGSVVFPDASVKFYLDAPPQQRCRRRAAELREAGYDVNETQLLRQIRQRDHRDMTRADGPLVCPEHAVVVNNGTMSLEQSVEHLARIVEARIGPVAPGATS